MKSYINRVSTCKKVGSAMWKENFPFRNVSEICCLIGNEKKKWGQSTGLVFLKMLYRRDASSGVITHEKKRSDDDELSIKLVIKCIKGVKLVHALWCCGSECDFH